jgi:hypothetical protein
MSCHFQGQIYPNLRTSGTVRSFFSGMNNGWPWENHNPLTQLSKAAALFERAARLAATWRPGAILFALSERGGLMVWKKFKTLGRFIPTLLLSTNASMNSKHNSPLSIAFPVRKSRSYTSRIVSPTVRPSSCTPRFRLRIPVPEPSVCPLRLRWCAPIRLRACRNTPAWVRC